MRRKRLFLALGFLATLAAPVAAQHTFTPVFKAPYRAFEKGEIGGSFSSAGDWSLEGFFGFGYKKFDLEARGGFIDNAAGGTDVVLGISGRGRVFTHTQQFPLDGALTVGVGGLIGDDSGDGLFIPVGLSIGRRFELEGSSVSLVPYLHPFLGPAFTEGDDDFAGGLGLGVDIRVARNVDIRVSGGIGDVEGIAIGVSFGR